MKKALVIGTGIAGIATAIRLRKAGYVVDVYEANAQAGGKLAEIRQAGFRFDAGPSLFTMPQYVEELFKLHGKKPTDYFEYEQLETVCQYFYEDGTQVTAYSDLAKFQHELVSKLGENPKKINQFFKKAKKLYDITNHVFLEKSLHKLSTYFNWGTFKSLLRVHELDVFRTMHQANQSLFDNPKTVQLFDRYATYNGSNPYQAPATLNIISHLEHEIGAFFPKGGMYQITQSLFKLAQDVGVQFHFNQEVQEISVEQGKATGIRISSDWVKANLVVSNMDVVNTYRKLLPTQKHPEATLNQPKSSSALIFYWGIDETFPVLDLHNIFFSNDYREEFRQIFEEKTISNDPTVYVFVSAKQVAPDAPKGQENWFVMINTPHNTEQNWAELIAQAKESIIRKLNRILKIDIAPKIICEQVLDARGIEQKTSSVGGSLYGTSSNNRYAAFLRHPNFSNKIESLYFCGGSVHPGGGIPLCLLSAKITADLVEESSK